MRIAVCAILFAMDDENVLRIQDCAVRFRRSAERVTQSFIYRPRLYIRSSIPLPKWIFINLRESEEKNQPHGAAGPHAETRESVAKR